jgi:hypothetical protein
VLLRHSFSGAGVTQFSADLAAIGAVVAKIVDFGIVDVGLGRVKQATRLLGLPIKGKEGKKDVDSEGKAGDVGLFEAGKRLFEGSGDDAKELLEEMGLDLLSVGDARKILARRVELGS